MKTVIVVEYDPSWPEIFRQLHDRIWPVVRDLAVAIEHVGSTSVPGLPAKPVIDLSVVVPSAREVSFAIDRLATLGYQHRGNLGIEGREAFRAPLDLPAHHLYLCPSQSPALENHLTVRDYLRAHPEAAAAYGELKKELARRFPQDMDRYCTGKTDFLLDILRKAGLPPDRLQAIESANR